MKTLAYQLKFNSQYEKKVFKKQYQFPQYQQSEKLTLILTEFTVHKKTTAYYIGNPGPGLGQAQKCGGVKLVNGNPSLPS